eukprot:TRINITY_DN38281_c0_g1_i1.p1 TRINITY_DN38281_c0_g1~~TRINITY_DN38281_c0_g1_i1.p1  ORF type:complete len:283 (+),score=24.21 TRINITY_DN38281_c0_g1_i1:142-990(+)
MQAGIMSGSTVATIPTPVSFISSLNRSLSSKRKLFFFKPVACRNSSRDILTELSFDFESPKNLKRRQLFLYGSGVALLPLLTKEVQAKDVSVGSYLPPAPSNQGFVQFRASNKDTPALRAGNVQPYQFILPPTWKQMRVANIQSGNYCQPKCAEPWVEAKFEDKKQGTIQVVASPLIRLTNKPDARIEEIATPEKLIASLGPFITGNSFDPDELIESNIQKVEDQTYYTYLLETPYASTGTHNLAKATAKGSTVVLFVASANDKQWPSSEKVLRKIVDSFQV